MTVVLETRDDFTLENFRRVAVGGEGVEIGARAKGAMTQGRENFMRLLDSDRTQFIYGTTSLPGHGVRTQIPPEQQHRASRWRWNAVGYGGGYLDERVVRGIVFARLVNYVSGNGKVRPIIAERVAALLDEPMARVPADGQVGAGEILPLAQVLKDLQHDDLEEGEPVALVNGSPCAAALAADTALHARHRLQHAEAIFALAIEAFRAPVGAYDEVLDDLWGDEDETAALQAIRSYLEGCETKDRLFHQAPVSYRIIPRALGQAHRAVAAVEKAARISLRSVTDNPVYVPADENYPLGRVLSTGGYHNSMVSPALNTLSGAWAELAFIAERQTTALNSPGVSQIPEHDAAYYGWIVSGFAEEARSAALPTLLPAAVNDPQDDVASTSFRAYNSERRAAESLDNALAGLAIVCSQCLFAVGREPAPRLVGLLSGLRSVFPVIEDTTGRDFECEAEYLASVFHAGALSGALNFDVGPGRSSSNR